MIDGLIIGTRKAGTSWLHSNFLQDPFFSTTVHTKETNYWGSQPRCSINTYSKLFQPNSGFKVECDASLCTDTSTISKLLKLKKYPSIVLILRNPYEFLVSRYIHSVRKAEVSQSCSLNEFFYLPWVQREIDYSNIIGSYKASFKSTFNTIQFEVLQKNPVDFYSRICAYLSPAYVSDIYSPNLDKVNVMRSSKFPFLSTMQTLIATKLRNVGLHQIVNRIKKTNIHSLWESQNSPSNKHILYKKAHEISSPLLEESFNIWNAID